jgi:hypothetical protein
MVKVVSKQGNEVTFDTGDYFDVGNGLLRVLSGDKTIAYFGPGEWQWASMVEPKVKDADGTWGA